MNNETNPLRELTQEESYIAWRDINGPSSDAAYDRGLHAWHYDNGNYRTNNDIETLKERLQSQSLPAVEQPEGQHVCCGMIKNPDTGQYQKEPHDLCGWSCQPTWEPSQPEGKTLEEPFGYVFENRFYKNLDQMSGQTFSEGNEPLAVYANQPCKEWISVEDRLPEDVGYYLCFDLKNYTGPVISGFFSRLWNPDISKVMQITHWQHLPDPPQK